MSRSNDAHAERLARILVLVGEALELADASDEFMLGAKLGDAATCAETRLKALKRE